MIKTFKCAETQKLYERHHSKKLLVSIQRIAMRKLCLLDAATSLDDLRSPPGNRLELLKGHRVGQHSIRINQQWRICFKWHHGHAYEVEIVDYH